MAPSSSLGDIRIDALADAVDNIGDEVYELSRDSKGGIGTMKTVIVVSLVGIVLVGGAVAILGRR